MNIRVSLMVLQLTLAAGPLHAQNASLPPDESRTRVVMLGTGNPAPNPERGGPASAVVVDSTAYLVDFGTGVVRSWNAATEALIRPRSSWRRSRTRASRSSSL
jgi:hypothetical protein